MQYLRRLVWYIASRLLVITLVLGLMVTGFYYAMNVTNINVVLKDGMARRAQVIMMTEDSSELTKYFQESFIQRDPQVQNAIAGYSAYKDYNIRSPAGNVVLLGVAVGHGGACDDCGADSAHRRACQGRVC